MIGQDASTRPLWLGLTAHASRFVRFGLVGGMGAVVNMAVLYMLVQHGGWNYLLAAVVATETAILSNFALNDRWTFRDAGSRYTWLTRMLRYNAIAGGGALISLVVLAILTEIFGLHYLMANLGAIGAGTIWNYVVNSRLTWTLTHLVDIHAHAPHADLLEPPAVTIPD